MSEENRISDGLEQSLDSSINTGLAAKGVYDAASNIGTAAASAGQAAAEGACCRGRNRRCYRSWSCCGNGGRWSCRHCFGGGCRVAGGTIGKAGNQRGDRRCVFSRDGCSATRFLRNADRINEKNEAGKITSQPRSFWPRSRHCPAADRTILRPTRIRYTRRKWPASAGSCHNGITSPYRS